MAREQLRRQPCRERQALVAQLHLGHESLLETAVRILAEAVRKTTPAMDAVDRLPRVDERLRAAEASLGLKR